MARHIVRTVLAALVALAATSCGGEFRRPDTTGHEVELRVEPFYKSLLAQDGLDAETRAGTLEREYGDYFVTFCRGELGIGRPGSAGFADAFALFLSAPENAEVKAACDSVFDRLDIDGSLSDAFSCFAALFPGKPVPTGVYCHFSGFNSKMFVDSTYISFGIEHYLGAGCRFYEWLQIPAYARRTRDARWIVSDLVKAWTYATMPEPTGREDVLTSLIYQGKALYATHRCIPDIDEPTLLGMDAGQVEWCRSNEARMWAYMAERKLLYSTVLLDKSKLINEAPFTSFFGNGSPGRAALWCAYNIVRGYARNHPEKTLADIMATPDAQEILQGSRYNP